MKRDGVMCHSGLSTRQYFPAVLHPTAGKKQVGNSFLKTNQKTVFLPSERRGCTFSPYLHPLLSQRPLLQGPDRTCLEICTLADLRHPVCSHRSALPPQLVVDLGDSAFAPPALYQLRDRALAVPLELVEVLVEHLA